VEQLSVLVILEVKFVEENLLIFLGAIVLQKRVAVQVVSIVTKTVEPMLTIVMVLTIKLTVIA
jgi:hypothetical protein